jgi:hypothetical protein
MPTPRDEIERFLHQHRASDGRKLDVAIVFAESMLRELGAAVAEWEKAAVRLRRLKRETSVPCSN